MKLKELAEKVSKLPKEITYYTNNPIFNKSDSIRTLPDSHIKQAILQLESENWEMKLVLSDVCLAYNILRDLILEAEVD